MYTHTHTHTHRKSGDRETDRNRCRQRLIECHIETDRQIENGTEKTDGQKGKDTDINRKRQLYIFFAFWNLKTKKRHSQEGSIG